MLDSGVKLGVSSRGSGNVNDHNGHVSDFEIVTVDVVAQPSAPNAYPTAIYEGLMNMKYGHKALEIAKEFPDIQFVIAGGGDLLAEVKSKAGKNVKVIGWADSSLMWSAVDVVLSTSDNEGMPIALIEAQLAGLPVVATDAGSSAEVVKSGSTGFIVSKNKSELVRALTLLISNSKKRTLFGKAAKVHAQKYFTVDNMSRAHAQMYKRV
jgi:glycosyltransferase involved in cell wall biosynthesis